jgi:hypothetical protein
MLLAVVTRLFVTTKDVPAAAIFTRPAGLFIVCAPVVPTVVFVLSGFQDTTEPDIEKYGVGKEPIPSVVAVARWSEFPSGRQRAVVPSYMSVIVSPALNTIVPPRARRFAAVLDALSDAKVRLNVAPMFHSVIMRPVVPAVMPVKERLELSVLIRIIVAVPIPVGA